MSINTKRKRKGAKTRSAARNRHKKTKRGGKTRRGRGDKKRCNGGSDEMKMVLENGGDDVFTFHPDTYINPNPVSFIDKVNEALNMFIYPLGRNNTQTNTVEIRTYNINENTSQYTYGINVLCNGELSNYACEFNENKMDIGAIDRCHDIMSGTDLIVALVKFADHIGIQESVLTDVAHIFIDKRAGNENPTEVDLGLYSILLNGYTWYEKFGFMSRQRNIDVINEERRNIRNLTINSLDTIVNNADFYGTYFDELLVNSTPASLLVKYLENVNITEDWNRYTLANVTILMVKTIKDINSMVKINDNNGFVYENAVKAVDLIVFIASLDKFGIKCNLMTRQYWGGRNPDGTFVINS